MTNLLIADNSKAGLVMSTEVFKEKVPGIAVKVATTGKDFLKMLAEMKPDMAVIDFDLPDVDGTSLLRYAQSISQTPIILTAYLDDKIKKIIQEELFTFNDDDILVEKPIKMEKLAVIIDKFLIAKKRIMKRFEIGKKQKLASSIIMNKSPSLKINGKLVNISLGGACISYDKGVKKEHIGNIVDLDTRLPAHKGTVRMKGKLCWLNNRKKIIGIKFTNLTEPQKEALEKSLRTNLELCAS